MNETKTLQEGVTIRLKKAENTMTAKRFKDYLFSSSGLWFWTTLILLGFTVVFVLLLPRNEPSLTMARYVLVFVFISFLPGYCLIETLFPAKDSLDIIERFALSVALSFAITMLTGLFLNFTPSGINLVSILVTLSLVTFLLASAALIRKHRSVTVVANTSLPT